MKYNSQMYPEKMEERSMNKYLVTYYECYSRGYEVEANSKEEAEEIVKNDIFKGRREAPDNCYNSGCNTVVIG